MLSLAAHFLPPQRVLAFLHHLGGLDTATDLQIQRPLPNSGSEESFLHSPSPVPRPLHPDESHDIITHGVASQTCRLKASWVGAEAASAQGSQEGVDPSSESVRPQP